MKAFFEPLIEISELSPSEIIRTSVESEIIEGEDPYGGDIFDD